MKIKRFKIEVSDDLDNILLKGSKTPYDILFNFANIKINLNINSSKKHFNITIIKDGKQITDYTHRYHKLYELYCVFPITIDKDILYLLKLEKKSKCISDSLFENKKFCDVISNPIEYIGGFDAYYDVMYTDFSNEDEFIKLCLRIIYMNCEDNWQELFRQKLDYVGYNIEKGKYNLNMISAFKTDTKKI